MVFPKSLKFMNSGSEFLQNPATRYKTRQLDKTNQSAGPPTEQSLPGDDFCASLKDAETSRDFLRFQLSGAKAKKKQNNNTRPAHGREAFPRNPLERSRKLPRVRCARWRPRRKETTDSDGACFSFCLSSFGHGSKARTPSEHPNPHQND